MNSLFFLLSLAVVTNTFFRNPFFIDFGASYFSPFNSASKGGSIDLVDTSVILFFGNERLYGGFSYNRIAEKYDFSAKNPFTLYIGRVTNKGQFWGFSLGGFSTSIKNYSFTDVLSKSEKGLMSPILYYSKRLDESGLVSFRVGFPFYKEILVTPTDTFNSRTRFSFDLSFIYSKQTTFQWRYFLFLSYFARAYRERFSTIQNLLNYDSTRTFSRFNASFHVLYSPFHNTFLTLGPSFISESDCYSLSTIFATQYELIMNLFLYFEYIYGGRWNIQRLGNFESKSFENYIEGPILGLRYRKDFLLFVLDYSFSERSFSSISVKFDFVR